MLPKVIVLACFAAFCGVGIAFSQTDGPAEQPAASYEGQSYVDSNGCIFLKAGYGGDATWVPRVGQDRKPICGQIPTNGVASATKAPAVRKARVRKQKNYTAVPSAPVLISCPVSVPVARRYATTDGGSVVVCTATNGSLTGARSPIYPAGSRVGAALSKNQYAGATIPLSEGEAAVTDDQTSPPVSGPTPVAIAVARAGTYYVQVGAFAQPSNADGASARVAALGLPVSKGSFSKEGQVLQVIFAGPFQTGADAQLALNAARGGGFSDAYIR